MAYEITEWIWRNHKDDLDWRSKAALEQSIQDSIPDDEGRISGWMANSDWYDDIHKRGPGAMRPSTYGKSLGENVDKVNKEYKETQLTLIEAAESNDELDKITKELDNEYSIIDDITSAITEKRKIAFVDEEKVSDLESKIKTATQADLDAIDYDKLGNTSTHNEIVKLIRERMDKLADEGETESTAERFTNEMVDKIEGVSFSVELTALEKQVDDSFATTAESRADLLGLIEERRNELE